MAELTLRPQSPRSPSVERARSTPTPGSPARTAGSFTGLRGAEKSPFGLTDCPFELRDAKAAVSANNANSANASNTNAKDANSANASNANLKDSQEKRGVKPEREADIKGGLALPCPACGTAVKGVAIFPPDRGAGAGPSGAAVASRTSRMPGAAESNDRTPELGSRSPKLAPRPLVPVSPPHGPPLSLGKVRQGLGAVNCYRGTLDWDDKCRLEVVEEHSPSPSPSPTAVAPSLCGPSLCRSRPMSPGGERTSFVTQLTAVAKNVLGPIKIGPQEPPRAREPPKMAEERQGGATGGQGSTTQPEKGVTGGDPPK